MYDTYICGATLNVLHSLSQIKIFKSNLISVEYFCATRGFSCRHVYGFLYAYRMTERLGCEFVSTCNQHMCVEHIRVQHGYCPILFHY